jgi:hypothetical protein
VRGYLRRFRRSSFVASCDLRQLSHNETGIITPPKT